MDKIKVVIVGKLPPPYIGPAVATKIILNSELNNDFKLFHLDTTVNKTVKEFGKGNLNKIGKNLKIYRTLIRLLSREKPKLILIPISQTTIGFIKDSIIILISSLTSTKILLQLRGSNFRNWMSSTNSISRSYVKYCMNKTEGMIVLGNNLKYLFDGYYLPEKIHVIPNGCDLTFPKKNIENKKTQLLYFANFLPSKGIKEILKSLIILKENNIDSFVLNAVGAWDNDEYKKECLRLVEQNKLEVSFNEPMTGAHKWQTFANADVFLFTPNSPEGHPWVIVEAMAAGLPIISTNQGAIVESVVDGENGFIVESTNHKQIAEKIEFLINNAEQRIQFGERSKNLYMKNYTESAVVSNFKKCFESIVKFSHNPTSSL